MADDSLKEFLTDQLAALHGLRARRMFGGFGLYQDKRFFGILNQGRLYFKTDVQTRPAYTERGMAPFVYEKGRRFESITYFEVPPDVLEDREQLVAWAQLAVAVAAANPKGRHRK
jgi:DNA transformation protein